MSDPLDVLGLGADASVDEIRSARRELAKRHHPDHGGDAGSMQAVNEAADAALARLESTAEEASQMPEPDVRQPDDPEPWSGLTSDTPSFTVEALPVEAFEGLLIVASWLGDVLDDDPPYRLDVHLSAPTECWCRLDVVPDAGASTVSLTVAGLDGAAAPDVLVIRDLWIANLNALDW